MNATLAESSAFAIDIDRAHSQRVIEHALRAGLEVSIWPNVHGDERPLIGPLVGYTEPGLVMQAAGDVPKDRLPLVSEYCEAGFRIEDARFMFTTNVLEVARAPGGYRLEIARPESLQVLQRRRYQRRDLHENSTVSLSPLQGGSRDPVEAALLNIGPGGLACRSALNAADRFVVGAPVRVRFALPNHDGEFRLDGRVRSKTRAAQSDHLILSVEFSPAVTSHEHLERLAGVLYGPAPALARG